MKLAVTNGLTTEVARQTVDCLLLSFDRLPIDLGGTNSGGGGGREWVYLFVTKAKAKAATFAAAAANGICNAGRAMARIQLQCLSDT